jgi:hypothetical protein
MFYYVFFRLFYFINKILGFDLIDVTHTGENIYEYILSVIEQYDALNPIDILRYVLFYFIPFYCFN